MNILSIDLLWIVLKFLNFEEKVLYLKQGIEDKGKINRLWLAVLILQVFATKRMTNNMQI